jgi:hypothetical protein
MRNGVQHQLDAGRDTKLVEDSQHFRAGAKGVFQFNQSPFRMLCKCVNSVAQGEIWMNTEHTHYMLDALTEVSALRVVNAKGRSLVTPREEQVVALVADGLTNREVASKLGLSENTIKKYPCAVLCTSSHPFGDDLTVSLPTLVEAPVTRCPRSLPNCPHCAKASEQSSLMPGTTVLRCISACLRK